MTAGQAKLALQELLLIPSGQRAQSIGPKTRAAIDRLSDTANDTEWRDTPSDDASIRPIETVPDIDIPTFRWPKQIYSELVRFFGPVGENQGKCNVPFDLVLDWDKSKRLRSFTCHEKVVAPLERIFVKLLAEYGEEKLTELGIDQFGGCLNVRKMRGGSSWSMHAWGIAVDLDADRNTLHENHTTARFARPEYLPMWRIIEAEGAVSLGRARDYDWMHFQFATL